MVRFKKKKKESQVSLIKIAAVCNESSSNLWANLKDGYWILEEEGEK